MTIPNFNSANDTNQASCLDLVPANQLVAEPICSWRLKAPQLELKVFSDTENIRYSVYKNHASAKCYWTSSASSPEYLISVFAHCVWKGFKKPIDSRLFSDGRMAMFVSVDLETKKIGIKEWEGGDLPDFLTKKNPIISAVNDDNTLVFQEEIRATPRIRPYAPKAEEGIMRWCTTEEGELVEFEGEPITEKTMKVWPGNKDVRLIKVVNGLRKEILCRVFNWGKKENLVTPYRFAPDTSLKLSEINSHVDENIKTMKKYTPEFGNVENNETITFYVQHPLSCFMPGYVLREVEASAVERWVCEQFYRKEGEIQECFEYTNFVRAKKIGFSFDIETKNNSEHSEIEAWHVEMKRQAGWILQFPIGISKFFAGIFSVSAQNPAIADKIRMERLVQGVPIEDLERNKIVDDFAMELGACSIINFYIACDRSVSELRINGRAWVRSFAGTGRGIRGAVVHGADGLAHLFGKVDLNAANRAVGNAAVLLENTDRLRQGLRVFRGVLLPQNNPENG